MCQGVNLFSPPLGVRGNRDNTVSREEALNPGNNLYVTGLSTRVTEKDLEDLFSREGKVFLSDVLRNRVLDDNRVLGGISL
jgi:transformer-2 protein